MAQPLQRQGFVCVFCQYQIHSILVKESGAVTAVIANAETKRDWMLYSIYS